MGPIALALAAVVASFPLSSGEPAPTHDEIITHGARLVDAPSEIPEPIYETEDLEINCPPPTRLRCWMATESDGGAGPTVYCKCSK